MQQRIRLIVGILVSLFFLAFARGLVGNVGAAAASLARADYWYLLPALVAYFVGVWLRAARWRALLRPVVPISTSRLFPIVVIGYMANDVLPARLGELVRAYVLGEQEKVAKTTTLATIVVERMFDGLALLLIFGAVALTAPLAAQVAGLFRVAAALFVGALLALFLIVASPTRALWLISAVEQRVPRLQGRVAPLAERFLQGLEVLRDGALTAQVLLLSLAAWLCESGMYAILARGFGLSLGFPAYLLTAAMANLGAMVPAAPGYVGTFDVGALAGLRLFGADSGVAGAYVLVLHLALLGPVTLLGFFYLWRANLSLRSLGRRATVIQSEEVAQ